MAFTFCIAFHIVERLLENIKNNNYTHLGEIIALFMVVTYFVKRCCVHTTTNDLNIKNKQDRYEKKISSTVNKYQQIKSEIILNYYCKNNVEIKCRLIFMCVQSYDCYVFIAPKNNWELYIYFIVRHCAGKFLIYTYYIYLIFQL